MAVGLWLAGFTAGLHRLMVFAYTPATLTPSPAQWPAELNDSKPFGRPLLTMFVHPACPCSRASVAELAILMASTRDRLDARVYVEPVPGELTGTSLTDVSEAAARIPGVVVIRDVGGRVATALRAEVSGEAHVYAPSGARQFRGGLTPARGHQGDNAGRRAIVELLTSPQTAEQSTPVFGCYLRASDSRF